MDVRNPRAHRLWVDLFALLNLAFLALDIRLAHATNEFHHRAEYIPLVFSCLSPVAFAVVLAREGRSPLWRWVRIAIGTLSAVVGIAGLVWHLDSRFFHEHTIASLVYTAPFAAPLAYTGIGLLILLNRMVDPRAAEWPRWILLLAAGGFVGNFVFSLADHAQNDFFYRAEWLSVIASALGLGFLLAPFVVDVEGTYLKICAGVMGFEVLVGIIGFLLHVRANLHGVSHQWLENFIYGAPAMAPLLFPNLGLLAVIGLWSWYVQLEASSMRTGDR